MHVQIDCGRGAGKDGVTWGVVSARRGQSCVLQLAGMCGGGSWGPCGANRALAWVVAIGRHVIDMKRGRRHKACSPP